MHVGLYRDSFDLLRTQGGHGVGFASVLEFHYIGSFSSFGSSGSSGSFGSFTLFSLW